MVLVELGNQITGALRKLNETTVIDQAIAFYEYSSQCFE